EEPYASLFENVTPGTRLMVCRIVWPAVCWSISSSVIVVRARGACSLVIAPPISRRAPVTMITSSSSICEAVDCACATPPMPSESAESATPARNFLENMGPPVTSRAPHASLRICAPNRPVLRENQGLMTNLLRGVAVAPVHRAWHHLYVVGLCETGASLRGMT